MHTTNDTARAALWEYVLGVDLVEHVAATNVPLDDPLRHLVVDPRRVRVDFLNDGLWIAPLDIRAALESRTYAVPGELVLDVDGERYALEGGPEGAECNATTRDPDLSCARSTLGMCLLGGNRWTDLAHAGLVSEHNDGALARADLMFISTPPAAMLSFF